jgi:hypothetical protein
MDRDDAGMSDRGDEARQGDPGLAAEPVVDQELYQEETQPMDRPGPQEPGGQEGVYDQEADQARRPPDGV